MLTQAIDEGLHLLTIKFDVPNLGLKLWSDQPRQISVSTNYRIHYHHLLPYFTLRYVALLCFALPV